MLTLARGSTTDRKYVLLGWIALLFGEGGNASSTGRHADSTPRCARRPRREVATERADG